MKNAIVTGASAGIGLALAWELSRRGYRVALTARRAGVLEEIRKEFDDQGRDCLVFPGDVSDAEMIARAVDETIEAWGPIDIAVANAGLGYPTFARKFDLEQARTLMRTNFDGTLTLFAAVIPRMIENGSGRFAAVASIAGYRGLPGASTYSASKAAMHAFLEASRVELLGTGVGVTVVNPGFIETAMTEKNKFKMPLLMKADEAAVVIADGIESGKRVVTFPLPMAILAQVIRFLPTAVYETLVSPIAGRKMDKDRIRR